MRYWLRWLGWIGAAVTALPLIALLLILVALNTRQGRQAFERLIPRLTGDELVIAGLSGRFPDALRAARVDVRDGHGAWLVIHDLELSWSPSRLLRQQASIDRLAAGQIAFERLPDYPPDTEDTDWNLPLEINVKVFRVDRVILSQQIIGKSATLDLTGTGRFTSPQRADLQLSITRHDQQGLYRGKVRLEPAGLHIELGIDEPPQGLLAAWFGLSELGRLSLSGQLEGPPSSAQLSLQLAAGELDAQLQGEINLQQEFMDLKLTASAASMRLRPGSSWQMATLDATIRGSYTQPKASGILRIDGLQAEGASVRRITAEIAGDATGDLSLEASIEGLRIPGPQPDLFTSAPVMVQAGVRLEAPTRPLTFTLKHPLLRAQGKVNMAGDLRGDVLLNAPRLGSLATLAGLEAHGDLELNLQLTEVGHATRLVSKGQLNLTGGEPYLVALLGENTKFDASLLIQGPQVALSQLNVTGKVFRLSANGRYTPTKVNFDWKTSVSELTSLAPQLSGYFAAQGRLSGSPQDLGVTATLNGEMTSRQPQGGPFKGELQIRGLMTDFPSATLTARAALAGSPVDASLSASLRPGQDPRIVLERAEWKSTRLRGAFVVARDAIRPVGNLEWRTDRLEDVAPWLGESLTGSVTGSLTTSWRKTEDVVALTLEGTKIGYAGVTVDSIRSSGTFTERVKDSRLDGQISLLNFTAGTVGGSAHVDFSGPAHAIRLAHSGTLRGSHGPPTEWSSTGMLNTATASLDVSTFKATWRDETLHLVAPVSFRLADGATVDSLRLRVRQADLQISGRLSPSLDLSAKVRAVPVGLATLLIPNFAADGSLNADARLIGPYGRPRGTISVTLTGVHLRQGSGRGMPPADVNLNADLDGNGALVAARLRAGTHVALTVEGRAPIDSGGTLDVRSEGSLDMKVLDPLLTPQGRRMRGMAALKARITGTIADPRLDGDVQFSKGEFQDYAVGTRMTDIVASAQFDGETLRLTRFDGKMAPGRISASGAVGLRKPEWPIDIKITARNARPLSGERLNVTLDSDLDVRGTAQGRLNVAGTVIIRRAEIRIPERMPARIAVLDVRKPGATPPPPPSPGLDVGLNLTIDAAREIFVRGRGLDAELGGKIRLQGTAQDPEPTGSFAMRRGEFKLAGRTLTFRKGEVGFDGGTLTDPALDFVASTSSPNITASLAIGGTASKPRISLSSVPDLPQDEILAQLLFGRNAASLGPLEMAEIASALAALTGVTGHFANPLETVRQGLGLDRLSMGSSKAGPTLEAGRYIAPGIYLGAKQGFTGATPSAAVQIDVTEGLKVEGTVGTGSPSSSQSGTSSAGVIYQFEY